MLRGPQMADLGTESAGRRAWSAVSRSPRPSHSHASTSVRRSGLGCRWTAQIAGSALRVVLLTLSALAVVSTVDRLITLPLAVVEAQRIRVEHGLNAFRIANFMSPGCRSTHRRTNPQALHFLVSEILLGEMCVCRFGTARCLLHPSPASLRQHADASLPHAADVGSHTKVVSKVAY